MARWRCRCKALARQLAWWVVRRWRRHWPAVLQVRVLWGLQVVPSVHCCQFKELPEPLVAHRRALASQVASVVRSARLTQSVPSTQSVLAILFRLLLHQASPGVRAVPALPAVQIAKALLGRLQWCLRVYLTYPLQRSRPAPLTGLVRLMQSLVLLARHPARLNVKEADPA